MNDVEKKTFQILTPAIAYGLGLLCPVVPQFVWSALIGAIVNEDITLADIEAFMKEHNIKTYSAPEDYPNCAPQGNGNVNQG